MHILEKVFFKYTRRLVVDIFSYYIPEKMVWQDYTFYNNKYKNKKDIIQNFVLIAKKND